MYSSGILYRVQALLDLCRRREITVAHFEHGFDWLSGAQGERILKVAISYGWVTANANGRYDLTLSGSQICAQATPQKRLRLQLQLMLKASPPSWGPLLKRGRQALLCYGDGDVVQCFSDAGLLEGEDAEVVDWWDEAVTPFRQASEIGRLKTGRKGERLSYEHELERIGRAPRWTALDDPHAGFDILSETEPDTHERLLIEVKTTQLTWDRAEFYLTRNEWETLRAHRYSVLHLWSLAGSAAELAVVDASELAGMVPSDNGRGRWETVRIPFGSLLASGRTSRPAPGRK